MSSPFAAVVADQIWNYDASYYRKDRFQVVRQLTGFQAGLWEVKEIRSGDLRNYTMPEIHQIASLSDIQPGQLWTQPGTFNTDVRMVRCFHSQAINPSPSSWLWEFRRLGLGTLDVLGEDLIFVWYARIDLSASSTTTRQSNGPCPRCGSPALKLLNLVECCNKTCPNFKP